MHDISKSLTVRVAGSSLTKQYSKVRGVPSFSLKVSSLVFAGPVVLTALENEVEIAKKAIYSEFKHVSKHFSDCEISNPSSLIVDAISSHKLLVSSTITISFKEENMNEIIRRLNSFNYKKD